MKKSVLIVAALITSSLSFAQEGETEILKTKKGHVILPQKGDIALGFNAVPILDFALNVTKIQDDTGDDAGNAIEFVENANRQIVGKYFLEDDAAVRIRLGVNTRRTTTTNQVQDAVAFAAAENGTLEDIAAARLITVEDQLKTQQNNFTFVVGYEKRRGYGRLQGFYGAEFGINWSKSDAQYEYGNAFSDVHNSEFTHLFKMQMTLELKEFYLKNLEVDLELVVELL